MDEKIAVIIPAKGQSPELLRCIESIFSLDYPNFELMVIDDGLEKDLTKKLEELSRLGKLRFLKSNGQGPSFARNLAALHTDAEFVAFTDSDCIVDKYWLKQLKRGFDLSPRVISCGGIQLLPTDASNFEKIVFSWMKKTGLLCDYLRLSKKEHIIEVSHNPSCCSMYKRNFFLKEGGFLQGLWPGEDIELDYRLKMRGWKILFNPQAIVFHYRPKNFYSFSRMLFRYGQAQGKLVRRYGLFRRIHFFPLFILLALIPFFLLPKNWGLVFIFCSLIVVFMLWELNIKVFMLGIAGSFFWLCGFFTGIFRKLPKD